MADAKTFFATLQPTLFAFRGIPLLKEIETATAAAFLGSKWITDIPAGTQRTRQSMPASMGTLKE